MRVVLLRARVAGEEPHLPLAVGPMRLLVAAAIFDGGTGTLALPVPAYRLVTGATGALVIFAVVWLLWRTTDVFARVAERRFASEGSTPPPDSCRSGGARRRCSSPRLR